MFRLNYCLWLFALTLWTIPFLQSGNGAQFEEFDNVSLPFEVEDQGPNHRTVYAKDTVSALTVSRYIELVSGGFRQDENGQWIRCDTEIELFQDGAIARKTQYQISWLWRELVANNNKGSHIAIFRV